MNEKVKAILEKIAVDENRAKLANLLERLEAEFPELEGNVKYSQPMYEAHGTFIIGFKPAKTHFGIIAEAPAAERFKSEAGNLGLTFTSSGKVSVVKWTQEIPFELIKKLVTFQLEDKKNTTTYFRK